MRTHVGQYRIEAALGRGGMGVVYRGVHEHLGRPVAIKVLAPELTQQPEFKERFFSEAKTQARLQHPNITAVYDLLEDAGEYFIVMELVAGQGLDDYLQAQAGRAMDTRLALGIFGQVLSALDYAHSEGIIHRDIKPSNVMITADGRVKLADFGIALLIGDKRLTASHSAIGTPTYMSPEQILRPRSVDHRTDIYSAAVVLYEMLAGRPPFDGETEYEIKKLHVEAPPPDLAALAPEVPEEAVRATATALSKAPDERFPSAGAFLRALQEAMPASAGWAAPAPAYRATTLEPALQAAPAAAAAAPASGRLHGKNRWIVLGAAAVLAVGLGFGIFVLMASSSDSNDTAPPATAESSTPPAGTAGGAPVPAAASLESPLVAGVPPGAAVPTANLQGSTPVPQSPPPPAESADAARWEQARPLPAQRPALDKARTRSAVESPPAPAETAEVQAPPAEPPPVAPRPEPASPAGVDQFNQMNDLIVNVERLSEQTLEAYEGEEAGHEGNQLWTKLNAFGEASQSTRREFRKATGTGIAGMKANVKGMLRLNRGGREADNKVLEVKVKDLSRRADEIDGLLPTLPLGPVAAEYWKEARRNLARLSGMFQ